MAPQYDRLTELKAFDATKTGVKGIVESRVTELPRMFHNNKFDNYPTHNPVPGEADEFSIPVIDLAELTDAARRKDIVEKIGEASEKWGFFQIVNHGIPESTQEEIKAGVHRFHEQDPETRKTFYTRDPVFTAGYNSNFDLYTGSFTNWRDTLICVMAPDTPNPKDLPSVCRDIFMEFSEHVAKVGHLLFELLSESLGLKSTQLYEMDCAEGLTILGHYYPVCPQPELTMGGSKHNDNDFLTILLQDHIGGLQVLYAEKWINVPPHPGALVVNIGDLLQILSNDRFKSVEHRVVLASQDLARVSVASFFTTNFVETNKIYGPIKELISENNSPKFRETTIKDYVTHFSATGLNPGISALNDFRI